VGSPLSSSQQTTFRGWNLALYAYAAIFYLVLYGPLLMIVVLSFNDSEIVGFPFVGWTTRWYAKVMESRDLVRAFGNSAMIGALTAFISTTLALLLALSFRHKFLGRRVIFQLILMPIVMPGIVGGITLLIFFGYLGIPSSLFGTVLVAHINWVLPFAFLTLYPRVHGFDRAVEEAATDLGARPLQVFLKVILPILKPAVVATAFFSFSLSFDEFIRTLFVTGVDRTIPVAFWGLVVEQLAPQLPAMAVVIIAVSIIASSLGFLFMKRTSGLTTQRTKVTN
jgi:spermidine/putrescine transport system permease protein